MRKRMCSFIFFLLCATPVFAQLLSIATPSPLPNGEQEVQYTQTLAATGGSPPYTWTQVAGAVPNGITLNLQGAVQGTPSAPGTSNFTVQVSDTKGVTTTASYALTIAPHVAVTGPSPLPAATVGVFYTQTFTAGGGVPPYAWSVGGSLPPGLKLDPTGVLSGTATSPGVWGFSIQVVDSVQVSAYQPISLTVTATQFSIAQPVFYAQSTVGVAYTQVLQANGGVPPYIWKIASGSPPAGVSLSAAGVVSGIPTVAGSYSFLVQVTDSAQGVNLANVQDLINPPITITTASPLPAGMVGLPYSVTISGYGGTPPVSGSIVSGSLPPGLALSTTNTATTSTSSTTPTSTTSTSSPSTTTSTSTNSGGAPITGVPTAAGNYTFTIRAVDGVGFTVTKTFAISIGASLAITSSSPLPAGTGGQPYSQTLSASGGTPPVNWSIASGALPSGLTLTAAGLLSGTPPAASSSAFTVQASDSAGQVVTRQMTLSIAPPLVINPAPLPGGNVGLNYAHLMSAAGGKAPYAWSVASGALPSGVTLSGTGSLFGAPTAAGSFNFVLQLTDAAQASITSPLSIVIAPKLTITSSSALPRAVTGKFYYQALGASGGTPPYAWSISSGALPAGLSLGESSGAITGVTTAAGRFSFNVQVTDSSNIAASSFLSLESLSPPAIGTTSPLAPAVTGTAYSQGLSASGGTPPYHWSVQSGALPAGLLLDASSGALAGTPSAPGRATFTVQLQDSAGLNITKPFEIMVTQTLQVFPASLAFEAPLKPQNIQVTSSTAGAPVAISASAAWLHPSSSHATSPAAISISSDPSGLAAGLYRGSVAVVCGDVSETVDVTLAVAETPAGLQISPAALNFVFAQGAAADSQSVMVTGNVSKITVSDGAPWLSASTLSGGALVVTANPSESIPGTYSGNILFDGGAATAGLTVTMSISAATQNLVLSQTGLTFTSVAGSGGNLSRSLGVLNTGQGSMDWSARSSTLSGGSNWLTVNPANGVSNSATRAAALGVNINPGGLAAGEYYGQVSVTAPAAGNATQLVSVVLNLLPSDKNPGAQLYPGGLIFTGVAGGPNPDPQTVTLTNAAASSLTYTSSKATDDNTAWIFLDSPAGSAPASSSVALAIQPNIAGLGPGVRQGAVTLQFGDGSFRSINLALVLRAGAAASSTKARFAAGCNPSKLVPLFSSFGGGFSVPSAWPAALEVKVVDDCGEPLTAGSVITTFSSGDPPLPLNALRDGSWAATWTPRNASPSGVILTAQARNAAGNLQGTTRLTAGVISNPNPPVISPGAIVSSASYAAQAPLAPGSLIAIFGSHLADGLATAQTLPLPTELGQTQVLLGGQLLPLIFVSDGQINAMLPYDLTVNTQHQLIVQRGTSYTTPEPIPVAAAEPAVFTRDLTGTGQGLVFDAHFQLVDSSHPAAQGDVIILYTAGLGDVAAKIEAGSPAPVDSLIPTTNPIKVMIGDVEAPQVLFAGLAPGFTGLYQVNVVIPQGVEPGDSVPVVISAADRPGHPVTIAVR